jgi:hypothetical protein
MVLPMAEIHFCILTLLDFVFGVVVITPLVCIFKSLNPFANIYSLSWILHVIPLNRFNTIIVISLLWTLLALCSNSTGVSWHL